MPEPQIIEENKEKYLIEKKEAILKESSVEINEDQSNNNNNILRMAEMIPLDLDSYNFDAFISKMRNDSCRPVLENIKR